MYIPESNQIPEEWEIAMDLQTVLQFYQASESIIADILLTDEDNIKRAETQMNYQITDDMLFRLWRLAMKKLIQLDELMQKRGILTEQEELFKKCMNRLEKAIDKEINKRTMI